MITLTENAKKYLNNETAKAGALGIKISVTKGGCSGMQYKFELANEGDNQIDFENFKVFIENDALLFVIGTELDYYETQTNAKLVFNNPNAKHNCGCGKSFAT